jgi:hypothetical protein
MPPRQRHLLCRENGLVILLFLEPHHHHFGNKMWAIRFLAFIYYSPIDIANATTRRLVEFYEDSTGIFEKKPMTTLSLACIIYGSRVTMLIHDTSLGYNRQQCIASQDWMIFAWRHVMERNELSSRTSKRAKDQATRMKRDSLIGSQPVTCALAATYITTISCTNEEWVFYKQNHYCNISFTILAFPVW